MGHLVEKKVSSRPCHQELRFHAGSNILIHPFTSFQNMDLTLLKPSSVKFSFTLAIFRCLALGRWFISELAWIPDSVLGICDPNNHNQHYMMGHQLETVAGTAVGTLVGTAVGIVERIGERTTVSAVAGAASWTVQMLQGTTDSAIMPMVIAGALANCNFNCLRGRPRVRFGQLQQSWHTPELHVLRTALLCFYFSATTR